MTPRTCISCHQYLEAYSRCDLALCADCEKDLEQSELSIPLAFMEH